VFFYLQQKKLMQINKIQRFTYRLKTSRSTTNKSVGVIVITVALRGSFVTSARSPKSKPPTKNDMI